MTGKIAQLETCQTELIATLEELLDLARTGEVVALVGVYVECDGPGVFDHRPLYLGDLFAGWETTHHRLDDMRTRLKADCDHEEEWSDFLSFDAEEE